MFLKRIELSGFKSFADPAVLSFEKPLTGIVGPNGCGKSNITDAVRFVLGEQSAKSLRSASGITDLIFSGSESRRPVNLARVTLVFDNSAHIFNSPFEEIEITRQISRSGGEVSCFLNKTPCRLKDIQELVMDTGLGRDSLSIISQGNITAFADAKPEDRRALFEEAAGVAKYKKRRKVSLGRLEAIEANLTRVSDLLEGMKEQKDSLEKQAEDARKYKALKEELSSLEISLLCAQIEQGMKESKAQEEQIAAFQAQIAATGEKLKDCEETEESGRRQLLELEMKLSDLQSRQTRLMEKQAELAKQKTQLDEKRKYAASSENQQEKAAGLQGLLVQATEEYRNRASRLQQMNAELQEAVTARNVLQEKMDMASRQIWKINDDRQLIQRRLDVCNTRLSSNRSTGAVRAVKAGLSGIYGQIRDLLTPQAEYESAIAAALSFASEQVAAHNENAARNAVSYLKKNRAGRATFLPLSACKNRTLKDWQMPVLEFEGIEGTADAFVSCQPRFDVLKSHLLGSILIARTLDDALKANAFLKRSVKIVTLDGDVIHAGGAISGGSAPGNGQAELQKEKRRLEADLKSVLSLQQQEQEKLQQLEKDAAQADVRLQSAQSQKNQLEAIAAVKKQKMDEYQSQLAALDVEQGSSEFDLELVRSLNEVREQLDGAQASIEQLGAQRKLLRQEQEQRTDAMRQLRRDMSDFQQKEQKAQLAHARCETRLEQNLSFLSSEYSLTWQAAREQAVPVDEKEAAPKCSALKRAIQALGSVNLQAVEQYDAICEKYEFMSSQKSELEEAAANILDAVNEMDETMKTQFADMFAKINENFDAVFKAMFGGGRARLVLVDPENLLETGVDVDVQPPGKAVKNLQTFSGGEKALIAICVLFAILKARTVPLCIFDEVEAALDQANVERFARYLSSFEDQSQFILVTHRPGTMEQCDTLYGITMRKDGVSQVLKVVLQEALASQEG